MAAKRKRPTGLLKRAPRTTLTPTDQRVWADMIAYHAEHEQAKQAKRKPVSDEQLEAIADMLRLAREIVEALESGETVETAADADANVQDAADSTGHLLAAISEYRRTFKPQEGST